MIAAEGWHRRHMEVMAHAIAGKSAPEMLFALYAEFEKLGPEAREEAIAALREEILSDDAGMAFDAQAIAARFRIAELMPALAERERALSDQDTPSARAELLTTRSFIASLKTAMKSAQPDS